MMHLGQAETAFMVRELGMEVCVDPLTQQQVLAFSFTVQVAVTKVLQQLQTFRFQDAKPPPHAEGGIGTPSLPSDAHGTRLAEAISVANGHTPARERQQQLQQPFAHAPQAPRLLPPPPQLQEQLLPLQEFQLQAQQQHLQQQQQQLQQQPQQLSPALDLQPFPLLDESGVSKAAPTVNSLLISAVRENSMSEVQFALTHGADVNCMDAARTPLLHAIEAGGDVKVVDHLLQARAYINAVGSGGKTPLHYAIQHFLHIPPVIIRMLLCRKADLHKPDARGTTPLNSAKMAAVTLQSQAQSDENLSKQTMRVKQLLHEVMEQPTEAVMVLDYAEVQRAFFADLRNDKLVFHTESSVGLYSPSGQCTLCTQRLWHEEIASCVQDLAVNPSTGTIAVCISIIPEVPPTGVVQSMQNMTIIWPNGQIAGEEPQKLIMTVDLPEGHSCLEFVPSCVVLSRGQGVQMLLTRLCDGSVLCLRLNATRSQVVHEVKLLDRGGLLAMSDDGCWIAAVNKEKNEEMLQVFAFESLNDADAQPKRILSIPKRPMSLAIVEQGIEDQSACFLAVSEAALPDAQPPPIEIFSVAMDGTMATVYCIQSLSPYHTLDFSSSDSGVYLLGGALDGTAIVCSLATGEIRVSHDTPGSRHIAIASDHLLLASVEDNYIRVFRVGT